MHLQTPFIKKRNRYFQETSAQSLIKLNNSYPYVKYNIDMIKIKEKNCFTKSFYNIQYLKIYTLQLCHTYTCIINKIFFNLLITIIHY